MPCSSSTRATAVPAWPAPKIDHVLDPAGRRARSARPTPAPPRASRSRRSGRRPGSTSSPRGSDRLVPADDARDSRVGRERRLAQRDAEQARVGCSRSTSNSTSCTCPSAKTSVCRAAGHADRPRDRVRRLELGRDDEVDVELALAPHLEVLGVRGAHDRRHPRCETPSRSSPRRCSSRPSRCTRSGGRPPRCRRREHPAAGAVALDRVDVVALRERGEPLLVEVERRSARARRAAPRRSSTPTWPAPMMKIFTRGRLLRRAAPSGVSCRALRSLLALACFCALGAACAAGASSDRSDQVALHEA